MCWHLYKEKEIVKGYLDAIKKSPRCFPKVICIKGRRYTPQSCCICKRCKRGITSKGKNIRDIRITGGRPEQYEKLYRCAIDSYKAKTNMWVPIFIIIASFLLIGGTVALCAFGPNFRGQENTNTIATTTTSSNTVVVGGYADRDSYRYTYFQESNNGRR